MDVALIQWPSDESLRAHLAQEGHPRLLLVESEADPPICADALEDWVRLPVSRADRNARIRSLEERSGHDIREHPLIHPDGTLEYRGSTVQLSEMQTRLVGPLIHRFGAVVSRDELSARAWPGTDTTANNLDVTIGRLRHQLGAAGLMIRTVRSRGYLLCAVDSDE